MSEIASENPDRPEPDEAVMDAETDRIEHLVHGTALKLAEHVDSVRIFVTVNRGDGNYGVFSYGAGNYFAQRDSVRDWLMRQDQSTRNEANE